MIGGGQLYTSSYAQISSLNFYFLHIFMKKREYHRANNFNKRTILASNVILFVVLLIVSIVIFISIFTYKYIEVKGQEFGKKILNKI